MARSDTRSLGRCNEDRALHFLERQGLTLVCRNFRCRLGEIDLVLLDKECLVFAEVRYRRPNRFSSAAMSVNHRKQGKIVRTAAIYLSRNAEQSGRTIRFDVISIDGVGRENFTIQWMQDAFRPDS